VELIICTFISPLDYPSYSKYNEPMIHGCLLSVSLVASHAWSRLQVLDDDGPLMRELWQRAHVGDPGNTQIPLLYEWHHGYGGGRKIDDAKAKQKGGRTRRCRAAFILTEEEGASYRIERAWRALRSTTNANVPHKMNILAALSPLSFPFALNPKTSLPAAYTLWLLP
jgi:hypothetical protein